MQIHLIYYLGFLWDVVVHVFCAGTACCVYIYICIIYQYLYTFIYIHMNMQIYYVQVVVGTERWISTIIPSREKVLFLRF